MIGIGKVLVTVKNVRSFLEADSTDFVLTRDMILSPGAKDYLRNRNYTICYEKKESNSLEKQISKILTKDCGFTDSNQISIVVKAVKEKLDI